MRVLLLLVLHCLLVVTNGAGQSQWLEAKNKTSHYYVELADDSARVYRIGTYFDKGGIGPSIRSEDLLTRVGNVYTGTDSRIESIQGKYQLLSSVKPSTKGMNLLPVKDISFVFRQLNQGYYLDKYFAMSREINSAFPIQPHSFRLGFTAWRTLPNQQLDHALFRAYADTRLDFLRDSIFRAINNQVSVSNDIIFGIPFTSYDSLLMKLVRLNTEPARPYFNSVIQHVAKQYPGYFFKLAEDFPDERSAIFYAVGEDKNVIQGLKAVEGHEKVKKEFFKERKLTKSLPFRIIGTYAGFAGLITMLIVSQ